MKKYLIAAALLLTFAACKHQDKPEKKNLAVQFAPPKVMANEEILPAAKDAEMPKVGSNNADSGSDGIADTSNTVIASAPGHFTTKDTAKKIIKEGDITFETRNVNVTRRSLLSTLRKMGGYADEDNESLSSDSDRKEYEIKARIPAKNFDVFVDSVASGAIKIDSKHISISDVTTKYIDMTSRLHNQKMLEATYLGLLTKASRMKDVLEVEDKLTDTRSEIESEQGQLNYMSRQIAYSSLDITFYSEQTQRETGNGAGYRLTSSVKNGWLLLQGLFFDLITVWPLTILAIIIIGLIRKWSKNRKPVSGPKASV